MFERFLQSWPLFHDSYLVALLLAAMLPLFGIVLVLRQQVFLSAALGQASTLGLAVGLWLGMGAEHAPGSSHEETLALGLALVAGVATAVLSLRALSARGSHLEARSSWVFLLGGSASVLLLANAPHGMHEVQRLLLSSILGASPADVWIAAVALVLLVVLVLCFKNRVLLWAMDPVTAQVHGSSPLRYDLEVGIALGLMTAFASHAAGSLFAFGVMVLPVLLARELCTSLRAVLWSAPLSSVLLVAVSLFVAYSADLPPGQVAVALMAILLPPARALRWLRLGVHAQ
ncbi:MAG TPA: metal ABC transporter permease [Planctomycetota bacterium]|nr:metal ABC transporter permease [Planctomycetota bacterium]